MAKIRKNIGIQVNALYYSGAYNNRYFGSNRFNNSCRV